MSKEQKATFLYTDTTGLHLRVYKFAMFSPCLWGISLRLYIVQAVSAVDDPVPGYFYCKFVWWVFFPFM